MKMSEALAVVGCPFCEKKFRIQVKNLGAKMRCKGCEQIFVAESELAEPSNINTPKTKSAAPAKANVPVKAPEVAKKKQDDEDDDGGAYGSITEVEVPRCPNCAKELESEKQVICLDCGFNNRTRSLNQIKRVQYKGFSDYLKWFAYPIFCTIVFIITLVMLILYYVKYRGWAIDNRNEDTIAWLLANQVSQIYIWVAALTIFWKCGRPAVTRFIFQPHPPEEEVYN
jgi:hypothetical protein